MNLTKQMTVVLVLMILIGSFLFSRLELNNFLTVDYLLAITFGLLLGIFLQGLRNKRNAK